MPAKGQTISFFSPEEKARIARKCREICGEGSDLNWRRETRRNWLSKRAARVSQKVDSPSRKKYGSLIAPFCEALDPPCPYVREDKAGVHCLFRLERRYRRNAPLDGVKRCRFYEMWRECGMVREEREESAARETGEKEGEKEDEKEGARE